MSSKFRRTVCSTADIESTERRKHMYPATEVNTGEETRRKGMLQKHIGLKIMKQYRQHFDLTDAFTSEYLVSPFVLIVSSAYVD